MGNELGRPGMEFSNRSVLSWTTLAALGVKGGREGSEREGGLRSWI